MDESVNAEEILMIFVKGDLDQNKHLSFNEFEMIYNEYTKGDSRGERNEKDRAPITFWKQVEDKAMGMTYEEFTAGWRELDQDVDQAVIEAAF